MIILKQKPKGTKWSGHHTVSLTAHNS